MRMGEEMSWIEIENKVPFRKSYFFWDKDAHYADGSFENVGAKVRYWRFEVVNPDKPWIGCIISCWKKDSFKVEIALDDLNRRLKLLDSRYADWLKEWRGGWSKS